ncbi:DCC1-like thiol-disulfide oxidoreductase family protein [Halosimplex halophilum]|uniref:DCC1-like thiol-disulfide oxidoreductase family protein n=1 Tax=Halosimplex halophilum TaxID=2559572 RepID=UPI00143563EF|nr:DCC1-like thiol-disulfide oxidoreductase family protein [Halosimplex halophilum]
MFVNYYDGSNGSVVNVAVARVLVAALGVWKLCSYDWASISRWEVYATDYYLLVVPEWVQPYLVVEKYLALVGLVCFAFGVSHRYLTPATAVLVAHLGAARFTLDPSGASQALFTLVYVMVFFALYRSEDRISVDGIRATGTAGPAELNASLQSSRDADPEPAGSILKWSLLTVGILYFGAGVTKIVQGPAWEWATARSLGQYILWAQTYFGVDPRPGRLLLQYPWLLQSAAIGTLILETGFLLWILARRDITPFVVGLLGMHVVVAVVMGPFFFDQIVFLLLFADWSRLLSRVENDAELAVVYDEHCEFCARTLSVFESLDVTDTIEFYSQSTAPAEYRDRPGVAFETAMYAFRGGRSHEGYDAFGALFRHFAVFYPVAVVMSLPVVRTVGERVYACVAANRDRHVTCTVDANADE